MSLINSDNIKNILKIIGRPKKKDLSVGDLVLIKTGEIGIVIDREITEKFNLFIEIDSDLIILFSDTRDAFYKHFSYLSINSLSNDLKSSINSKYNVVKVLKQPLELKYFYTKDILHFYLNEIAVKKFTEIDKF